MAHNLTPLTCPFFRAATAANGLRQSASVAKLYSPDAICTFNETNNQNDPFAAHPEALKRDWAQTAALEPGEVWGQLNRWTESIKAYQLALTLKPKDAFAHNFLGESHPKNNDKVQYNILKALDADLGNGLLQSIPK